MLSGEPTITLYSMLCFRDVCKDFGLCCIDLFGDVCVYSLSRDTNVVFDLDHPSFDKFKELPQSLFIIDVLK